MSISLRALRKRKVVDTSTAATIGRVREVRIDPSVPSVTGFVLKGDRSGFLPLGDVISIGEDAITVASADSVVEDVDDHPTSSDGEGSRLLDEAGYRLGKVRDFGISEDGSIVSVSTDDRTLDGKLLGIGSYAVVIARQ